MDYRNLETIELRRIVRSIGIRNGGPTGVYCDKMSREDLLSDLEMRQRSRRQQYGCVASALAEAGMTEESIYVRENLA